MFLGETSMIASSDHSYPAIHCTLHDYDGTGILTFTMHVHPNVPQNNQVYLYGINLGGQGGLPGEVGLAKGSRTVVYHCHSFKKINKSLLVPGKFVSFHVFFMLIISPQCYNYK